MPIDALSIALALLSLSYTSASCVTFREILAGNELVTCASGRTITGDKDACTWCERLCPSDIPVADCVVITNLNQCPVSMPTPNSHCASDLSCNYKPYCGQTTLDNGASAERCMFLAKAECVQGLWLISMASSPSPKQMTCGDVRRSYSAQKCCDDESQEFDVHLI